MTPRVEQLEDRMLPAAKLVAGLLDVRSAGGTVSVVRDDVHTTVYENNVETFQSANADVKSAVVRGSKTADVVQIVGDVPSVVSTYDGDDLVFIGTGAASVDLGDGRDVGYAILSRTRFIDRDADADHYFLNPTGHVELDASEDEEIVFFRGEATPGNPFVGVDADGTLAVTTGNRDSYVRLDEAKDDRGRDTTKVTYDLGDGKGFRVKEFYGVHNVAYFGGLGDDVYQDNTRKSGAAYGGFGGKDIIVGGRGKVSVLKGLSDDDILVGRAQRNVLQGGAGADVMAVTKPGKVTDVYFTDLVFSGDVLDADAPDFVSAP